MSPAMSAEEFRAHAHKAVDWLADYWDTVHTLPVQPSVRPGDTTRRLPATAPERPEDFAQVLKDLDGILVPGLTHWQHPSFFGYFPANTSGPSVLGDILAAGLNVQGMLWSTGPAATELETTACEWLRVLLDLPAVFQGNAVLHDTATSSCLMAMTAALNRAGGSGWRTDGDTTPYTCYTSEQANVMVQRVCRTVGIGDRRLRRVPTATDTLAMRPDALLHAIQEDLANGLTPLAVIATVGTTSTCAIDPLPAIADICRRHGIWLHVDAAYAGAAAVCPEHRWINDGARHADSYSTSPHKWLLTGFDCSVLWLADPSFLLQSTSTAADYLATDPDRHRDLGNWQLPLGRRLRALKLWSVLRCHGQEGLREHIRRSVAHARHFTDLVTQDERFELAAPPRLGLVCFRLRSETHTRDLIERLNASGRLFLSATRIHGTTAARLATGGTLTRDHHVEEAWHRIRVTADALCTPPGRRPPQARGAGPASAPVPSVDSPAIRSTVDTTP
ncbi:pyridoxal phosphate-dependent decarboxylase family protein [Streptomyces sp. NPDC016562]|uniref:pyridoxal phosphate-dependent decarboxylase family protein n=1 Tax=Streptomyces sp. NPDC016562 TaxID=3364966 RepID=UPI0036FEB31C